PGWPWLLAGFALFRLLDIWKPWPIRWVDRQVHGGTGIMLDDLLAGAGAWLLLQGLVRLLN
ncbi:MAG TPA: phosphatidylglycerophosphatase A, partial [Pseudomonas sp.]|nr:phosphatidylglycerophosphatase A [Pseudomonas sp.]